jgi:DNA modification methylase
MTEPALYGIDLFGEQIKPQLSGAVAEKFIVSPFSILNARDGFWQERKRAWLSLGIKGEVSREDVWNKGDEEVRAIDFKYEGGKDCWGGAGVSVFDPVLCEVVYRWFCPPSGQVIDPFAGGSVRGIVANLLGFRYWGCDLRPEQIAANNEQMKTILLESSRGLEWCCGDSMEELGKAPNADFVFSCPPYGDLEKYSDDPRDISNMEYHAFVAAYKRIILRSVAKLKENRFACFVVGDFRDERGFYRGFVAETISAFRDVGLSFYNEAIFITPTGSLPIRITRQFNAARKLGKTHQNVLVFVKGDPKKATQEIVRRPP